MAKKLTLNGYIDDESWFGDEITPELMHSMLYDDGIDGEDVEIILNSYGGSCNAATRIYDELKAYNGHVSVTISGTAASAATVIAQGADELHMTPGSLFMIHDPLMVAYGNEADLKAAIKMLSTCKDSIINIYQTRSKLDRDAIATMMTKTTWMDAFEAQKHGFVDSVLSGSAEDRVMNRSDAEKAVNAWAERHNPMKAHEPKPITKNETAEKPVEKRHFVRI